MRAIHIIISLTDRKLGHEIVRENVCIEHFSLNKVNSWNCQALDGLASLVFQYENIFHENILVKNFPFSGLLDITFIARVFFKSLFLKYSR